VSTRFWALVLATAIVISVALFLNLCGSSISVDIIDRSDDISDLSSSDNTNQLTTPAKSEQTAKPAATENQEVTSPTLQIVAMCRGASVIPSLTMCQDQFKLDNYSVSPGEYVNVIVDRGYAPDGVELKINDDSNTLSPSEVALAISHLVPGTDNTLKIREFDSEWSEPFAFKVDLLPPLRAEIYALCVDVHCAPGDVFPFSRNVPEGTVLPLVEYVVGPSSSGGDFAWLGQGQTWIELQLDDDPALGCINCNVAESFGSSYEARIRFGTGDVFYNWDLRDISAGMHILRARLVNARYRGSWSEPFEFEVK
jgi:hypothetical protein